MQMSPVESSVSLMVSSDDSGSVKLIFLHRDNSCEFVPLIFISLRSATNSGKDYYRIQVLLHAFTFNVYL